MIKQINQWKKLFVGFLLVAAISIDGCDFLDPTEVTNPQTTEKNLEANATGATTPFVNGVQFRFSDSVEDLISA